MSFALGSAVNPPTVFIAWRSELRDRFDPEIVLFRRKTQEFKYPVAKMQDFFYEPPQYGAGERGLKRAREEQARYIRITDIDEYGLLTEELGATAAAVDPRYILEENDLLIARSGTVGKSYIHKREHSAATCFFAGYLIRFRFHAEKVLPGYVFAFTQLPYYKEWVQAIQRVAVQPNINAQEYSNLEIPVPPISVQQKVISLLEKAYRAKRQRDENARNLLTGIDDILLDELGISQKFEPPNTLKSRIFRRSFSSLSGKRIDPAASWKEFSLGNGRFPVRKLRDLAIINPSSRFPNLEPETPVSFVPMDAVSDVFGEIAGRYTRPVSEAGSYTLFQNGDVLWAKITPCMENGKSVVAEGLSESIGYGSTEFHVFRPNTSYILSQFLHYLLRLKIIRNHARMNFTGSSGHQRVDQEFFQRIEIPLPPKKIQERIVARSNEAKEEARNLFAESRADLETAKRDIEALILGKEPTE